MHGLRVLFLVLLSTQLASAQHLLKQYRALAKPEKRWVKRHVFVARKAFRISKQAEAHYRRALQDSLVTGPENGGLPDAFRHALWMAMLTQHIGKTKALRLGMAHEEANYEYFRQHRLEYGQLPDSVSRVMDLFNNEVGADLGVRMRKAGSDELQLHVLQLLRSGKLYILKTDSNGQWLSCDHQPVDYAKWQGRWNIPKCLVPSY